MSTNKILIGDELIAESYSIYNDLENRPSINNTLITGDMTNDDLYIYSRERVDELIENSKIIRTYPDESSFTPEPNIQYYIGPDENGNYKIYTYTETGEKIVLGDTKVRLDIKQLKEPKTNNKYDIGHIDGVSDNKLLKSHKVVDAINEVDTIIQTKSDKTSDALTTNAKTIVGGINEIQSKFNSISVPFQKGGFQSSLETDPPRYDGILQIDPVYSTTSLEFVNATFWVLPNFANGKDGPTGPQPGTGSDKVEGSLFHYSLIVDFKTGAYTEYLFPLIHTKNSLIERYPLNFTTVHMVSPNASVGLMIGGRQLTKGKQFKIMFVNLDYNKNYVKVKTMPGIYTQTYANPKWPYSSLGYSTLSFN